jgi:hypothetical protein
VRSLAPFRSAGVARAFTASLVGRLPMTALGLLLVLKVRDLGGSYAVGGAAASALALAIGVSSPAIGRLVDRRGQRAVLGVCTVLAAAVLLALALLPATTSPGVVVVLALAAGAAMPPLSSAARALWSEVLDGERRRTLLAVEASVQELTFIVGPLVLVTGLASFSTDLALGGAAVVLLGGCGLYLASPLVAAWRARTPAGHGLAGALAAPGVRVLGGLGFGLGSSFGAIEVGMTAWAEAAGHRPLSGLLIAVWGAGSAVGGAYAIRRRAAGDPPARLALTMAVMALADAVPGVLVLTGAIDAGAAGLAIVAVLFLVAGAVIAPGFALTYSLLGELAPAGTVTEAYAWLGTGIATGLAAGAAAGGLLVDGPGPGGAWLFAAGAVAAGAVLVRAGAPQLRPASVPAA